MIELVFSVNLFLGDDERVVLHRVGDCEREEREALGLDDCFEKYFEVVGNRCLSINVQGGYLSKLNKPHKERDT